VSDKNSGLAHQITQTLATADQQKRSSSFQVVTDLNSNKINARHLTRTDINSTCRIVPQKSFKITVMETYVCNMQ